MVPMLVVALALFSSARFFGDVMAKIRIFLSLYLLPDIAARIVDEYIPQFAANAARLTWAGIATVFVLAVWLMLIMDRSLNVIWRAREPRPYWMSVIVYAALLVLGPLLIGVSVSFTTYLFSLSHEFGGADSAVHAFLLRSLPVSVSAAAFFLVYRFVPHRPVPWRHAIVGGVVAALLFETAKELFALYVRFAPAHGLVYGAFAAVPIFLIWIYVSWLVILFGAELTAAAAYWSGGEWKRAESAALRFREGIVVATRLAAAHPAAMSLERLLAQTGLELPRLEDTLAELVDARVAVASAAGYSLADESLAALALAKDATERVAVRKAKRGRARNGRSSR